jgi:mevalonate pyrophosphate decarboxylase
MVKFNKYKNIGKYNSIILSKENIKDLDLWLNYNGLYDEKQIKKVIKYIKNEFDKYPDKIKSLKNFENEYAIAVAKYDDISKDKIEILFYENNKIYCARIKYIYRPESNDYEYKIINFVEISNGNFEKIKDIINDS